MDTIDIPVLGEKPKKSKEVTEVTEVKKVKRNDALEHAYYTTYLYRGVPYIPHYRQADCYVPPNYTYNTGMEDSNGNRYFTHDPNKEFTASQLEKAGAVRVPMYLWKRARYPELL